MRTEKKIVNLVLSVAQNDKRIRAVGINGSRTNPNVPKDEFQDYDIVYLVTDMDEFIQDRRWVDIFGKRIMMQTPEAMSLFPPELGGWFSYLMLFEDGNRIDLMLIPVEDLDRYLNNDQLIRILLDKDGTIPQLPLPSDKQFHVKKPSLSFYDDCCNEFWWTSTYVAKGLCRDELLYAAEHLSQYVLKSLLRMLSWKVGLETKFGVSVGKSYKYLKNYLDQETYSNLMQIYCMTTIQECWNSLFRACELFKSISVEVGHKMEFTFPDYDEKVTPYLNSLYERYVEK